jgi:sigma-E factor negative regulatory protein RseA
MNMTTKHDDGISRMLDGELSEEQLDKVLATLKTGSGAELLATWNAYHLIGDVLRSDEMASSMSPQFSETFSRRLDAEPVLLAPKQTSSENNTAPSMLVPVRDGMKTPFLSRYVALTSVAAAVIVAFVMAPQLIGLLNPNSNGGPQMAQVEQSAVPAFSGVRLAANKNAKVNESTNSNTNFSPNSKESEFAPKLEKQVEMLRDPRLDSYLLAHQKVSPSFDNSGRNIKRANVVPTVEVEK